MAVTGKLVVFIVFGLGILLNSPFMIFNGDFLQGIIRNITSARYSSSAKYSFGLKVPVHHRNMVRYLGQEEAVKIDEELFNEYKFSVDQLMELAGLSVATAIQTVYGDTARKNSKVLVIAGPGNNGGDGMVAARHLKLFGFSDVSLLNARKPSKDIFVNLVKQAELNDVNISYDADSFINDTSVGLIVDALFGFSFRPPVRPDFQKLMNILTTAANKTIPIVSVDIPSGWDVEKGPSEDKSLYFMPDTLVSLTAPKESARNFTGAHHYLGGRFVPNKLAEKYTLDLPQYPGTDCIVAL